MTGPVHRAKELIPFRSGQVGPKTVDRRSLWHTQISGVSLSEGEKARLASFFLLKVCAQMTVWCPFLANPEITPFRLRGHRPGVDWS